MKLLKLILFAVIIGAAFGVAGGLLAIWFPEFGSAARGGAVGAAVGVIVAVLGGRALRGPAKQP